MRDIMKAPAHRIDRKVQALLPYALCILLWLLGSALPAWAAPDAPNAANAPARGLNILMFNSFDAEAPFFQSMTKGFKETLKTTPGPVTIYYEHLDSARFPHRRW